MAAEELKSGGQPPVIRSQPVVRKSEDKEGEIEPVYATLSV